MSVMLATVNPEAAAAIGNIKKVGIGNPVVYHARAGYMRDKRTSFPALVMHQHDEDGSLDLLVFMEREDFAFEQRVAFRSHNQPHHCWTAPEDAPSDAPPATWEPALAVKMMGFIDGLIERVAALEAKRGPGRPPKAKA